MTLDERFQFISHEYSIIVNHFGQHFDKRYCLVLWLFFALIILMVEFVHFIPLI